MPSACETKEYSDYYQKTLDRVQAERGTARVSATITGGLLEVKVHAPSLYPWKHKRGFIKDFSPTARKRMLRKFWTINFTDHVRPIFITLTYPDALHRRTLAERNLDRQNMARQLERMTGQAVPAAWRVEWQLRKSGLHEGFPAPHWHWLIFRHRYIHMDVVNEAWKRTLGFKGTVVTDTRGCKKPSVIQMYMAKYISKEAIPLYLVKAYISQQLGRQYGWLRQRDIPWHSPDVRLKLSEAQQASLFSMAEEQLPWYAEGQQSSFTLTGAMAEDARRILDGELLDE